MAEIYKSLSIGNIQIMATFNFGNFPSWRFSIQFIKSTNFQQEILKSLSTLPSFQFLILAISNFGNFQFWQLSILATFNFGNLQFWQLSILATFNFNNFQFRIFASKIFQFLVSRNNPPFSACMDLAIKNFRQIT